jgi:hypothetical protein
MITSTSVRALWSHLQSLYNTTVTSKRDAPEMRFIASVINTPGFLDHYTTTLGRLIYTPFTIGEPNDLWSLDAQAAVAAHEHQHVVQLNRDGMKFYASYLLNPSARAVYETEAYRASLELRWFLGDELHPDDYANSLINYGCRATDIAIARTALEESATDIGRGNVMTEAAQQRIFFLCS